MESVIFNGENQDYINSLLGGKNCKVDTDCGVKVFFAEVNGCPVVAYEGDTITFNENRITIEQNFKLK